jgi:hypothetical protein
MSWQFRTILILGIILLAIYILSYITVFKERYEKPYFWALVGLSLPFYIVGLVLMIINVR